MLSFPKLQILKIITKKKMEEKSIIDTHIMQSSLSDWKLRHKLYETSRNYRQLQNRLSILQLQKKKKLKDIQNKLNQHKKYVETKIYKYQLKTAIQGKNQDEILRSHSNSRIFHLIKENRNMNIRKNRDDILSLKHKAFEETKQSRIQNQRRIMMNKLQALQEKVKKRNKVRQIEIECKENIENFWNSRLQDFQVNKKIQMSRKAKIQQDNFKRLQNMEKNQETLLEEIRKAENVESELISLIDAQKSMNGDQLNSLYFSKVIKDQL